LRRIVTGAAIAATGLGLTGIAIAQIANGVSHPQPDTGTPPNLVAGGFSLDPLVRGTAPLENPSGQHATYGYLNDNADPLARTRTEPDQNTYVVTRTNPGGPTDGYDYGEHFLIQGHENGSNKAYLTRINLDVTDPDHRITLLNNETGAGGLTGITSVDGSTYDPFNGQLLFTQEAGAGGGVVSTPLRWKDTNVPPLTRLDGSLGKGGYEGIHPDSLGNVYIVEDTGGSGVTDTRNGQAVVTKVKQPNSFVYRFKPVHRSDLTQGKLQALQVSIAGTPITFHPAGTAGAQAARDDALGEPIRKLHSGMTLAAAWVTIHDTATDGTAPFDANALAKAKGATPLKRPENGKFVPKTDFKSFVFTETGDTDKDAGEYPGAAERGAWGAFLRLDMPAAGADTGSVLAIEVGDAVHSSFDNVTFLDRNTFLSTEDRGDTLHQQAQVLDSVWSFDLRQPLARINRDAERLVALGRDPESLNNQHEDNEPTGIFVSNGSTLQTDILGAGDPARDRDVRMFLTQQHGQNVTFEVVPDRHGHHAHGHFRHVKRHHGKHHHHKKHTRHR
jgi:hypothetical protein